MKNKRMLCMALAAVLLVSAVPQTVFAEETQVEERSVPETVAQRGEETVVTTTAEFTAALKKHASPIVVDGVIAIGEAVAADKRMLPVTIPGNTVITGKEGSSINCRGPIQLVGDNVTISNIELTFSSSNAMGSVPHREIFLAGHDLTLDHVSTYLAGSDGSLGGFGGSESELLPSVYAGSFTAGLVENAVEGSHASLVVTNADAKTMFQGIYLGHGAGDDNKVPYTGAATLALDSSAAVRDGIYAAENSSADITISGDAMAQATKFTGSEHTTLTVGKTTMTNTVINGVGNLVLSDDAWVTMQEGSLANVSVSGGACLDFSQMTDAIITGDFSGGTYESAGNVDERGILVLNGGGSVQIGGNVTGTTIFRTGSKVISSGMLADKAYITAPADRSEAGNFMLSAGDLANGFVLNYQDGVWKTKKETGGIEIPEIGAIEIVSAPKTIDLTQITGSVNDAVYCKVKWYDTDGDMISYDDVEYYGFSGETQVFAVRSEYWNSTTGTYDDVTDWGTPVLLVASDEEPGVYYFVALGGAKTGEYIFLFGTEEYDTEGLTVADLKAAADTFPAKMQIRFTDGAHTPEPEPTETPEETETEEPTETPEETETEEPTEIPEETETEEPTETPEETETEESEHTHAYIGKVTRAATCTRKGVKTYTCGCGASYTEELPLKSHTVVTDAAKCATTSKDGKTAGSHCSVCKKVIKKQETIYRPKNVKLQAVRYVYDGKAKKPSVKVYDTKGKVIGSSNYKVTWKNNKNVGNATATVSFTGKSYSGTLKAAFVIAPKGTSVSKVVAEKRGFTVKWKKQNKQTKGYEVQYATNSKFSGKDAKIVNVGKNSTTSKKVTKLTAKKKYYVRVRTYQTVKVNGKSKKIYSDWSKASKVTTKK